MVTAIMIAIRMVTTIMIAIEMMIAIMTTAIIRIAIMTETMTVIASKEMITMHLLQGMNGTVEIKEMITGMIGETGMTETIAPMSHMKETTNGTSVIAIETMITIPQEEVVSIFL